MGRRAPKNSRRCETRSTLKWKLSLVLLVLSAVIYSLSLHEHSCDVRATDSSAKCTIAGRFSTDVVDPAGPVEPTVIAPDELDVITVAVIELARTKLDELSIDVARGAL